MKNITCWQRRGEVDRHRLGETGTEVCGACLADLLRRVAALEDRLRAIEPRGDGARSTGPSWLIHR